MSSTTKVFIVGTAIIILGYYLLFREKKDRIVPADQAQTTLINVSKYYVQAAQRDDVEAMKSVCLPSAKSQTDYVIKDIHDAEAHSSAEFDGYAFMNVGAGKESRRVTLFAGEGNMITYFHMMCEQQDGKWWVRKVWTD
jgi:hypothetical protein